MDVLEYARRYVAAGLSVIPIQPTGTKSPALPAWKPYQGRLPTDAELVGWLAGTGNGVGVIGGVVSGGLTVLDFESAEAYRDWLAHLGPLAAEAGRCPLAVTPGGGRHLYVRSPLAVRNVKLARGDDGNVSIETRGEGGYVLAPGSPPACHPTGRPYTWESWGWLRAN